MAQYSKSTIELAEKWQAVKEAYFAAPARSPEQAVLRQEYDDLAESLAFAVGRDIRDAR